jgi:hypothetical protein
MREEVDSEDTSEHRLNPAGDWVVSGRFPPAKDTLNQNETIVALLSHRSSDGVAEFDLTRDQLMVTGSNFNSAGSKGKSYRQN